MKINNPSPMQPPVGQDAHIEGTNSVILSPTYWQSNANTTTYPMRGQGRGATSQTNANSAVPWDMEEHLQQENPFRPSQILDLQNTLQEILQTITRRSDETNNKISDLQRKNH
ncbi:hypothetical protein JTB14_017176 [Gonioctena quinquepunctata]|nr:hypothetical protein JTB14_017176 [Gonioctena quinquepunctata]